MYFDLFNLAIIIFLIIGLLFGILPLIISLFLAPRVYNGDIDLPYECGIVPHGTARVQWNINFYFYALLFLAFDVDVLYLFPVAVVYSNSYNWSIFLELAIFIAILGLAIFYFWRKGIFIWPQRIN